MVLGGIFSILKVELSSTVNDFLTLNSLFAISISWGLFRTSSEFGFGLSSVKQFIENNLFDFLLEGNSFELFRICSVDELKKKCGCVSNNAQVAMNNATRGHPKFLLSIDSAFSSLLLATLVLLCSFVVPAYLKWKDLRWNRKRQRLMLARDYELQSAELSDCLDSIFFV